MAVTIPTDGDYIYGIVLAREAVEAGAYMCSINEELQKKGGLTASPVERVMASLKTQASNANIREVDIQSDAEPHEALYHISTLDERSTIERYFQGQDARKNALQNIPSFFLHKQTGLGWYKIHRP